LFFHPSLIEQKFAVKPGLTAVGELLAKLRLTPLQPGARLQGFSSGGDSERIVRQLPGTVRIAWSRKIGPPLWEGRPAPGRNRTASSTKIKTIAECMQAHPRRKSVKTQVPFDYAQGRLSTLLRMTAPRACPERSRKSGAPSFMPCGPATMVGRKSGKSRVRPRWVICITVHRSFQQ